MIRWISSTKLADKITLPGLKILAEYSQDRRYDQMQSYTLV